jgi:hypothetical protein
MNDTTLNALRARIAARVSVLDARIRISWQPGNKIDATAMQEVQRLDSALRVLDEYAPPTSAAPICRKHLPRPTRRARWNDRVLLTPRGAADARQVRFENGLILLTNDSHADHAGEEYEPNPYDGTYSEC